LFSKQINSLILNANTIQLSAAGNMVLGSLTFSSGNSGSELVSYAPYAPLPDATPMTLTISGITDYAGHAVASRTIHFTTGTGADLVAPVVVNEIPFNNATNVPINAVVQIQAGKPLDPGTVNNNTFFLQDTSANQIVPASYSVSTDGRT